MVNHAKEINKHCYPTANRKVKDSLFRFIFNKKKELLSLYNAINDSNYTDEEALEVNTLEDVVYISMKNDVSFLIGDVMNLYEHQSSYNPNMPMRGLMYLVTLYKKYIDENKINLYGKKLQQLPNPQYIVFYNGLDMKNEREDLKLSDAFLHNKEKEPCLECRVTMLNINYGHNRKLMEKCTRLEEYAMFVAIIRKYQNKETALNKAVELAMDACIEQNILKDILINQRSEVKNVVLTTFDKEAYEKAMIAEGYADGEAKGIIEMCQEFNVTKEQTVLRLIDKLDIFEIEAKRYIEQYWK